MCLVLILLDKIFDWMIPVSSWISPPTRMIRVFLEKRDSSCLTTANMASYLQLIYPFELLLQRARLQSEEHAIITRFWVYSHQRIKPLRSKESRPQLLNDNLQWAVNLKIRVLLCERSHSRGETTLILGLKCHSVIIRWPWTCWFLKERESESNYYKCMSRRKYSHWNYWFRGSSEFLYNFKSSHTSVILLTTQKLLKTVSTDAFKPRSLKEKTSLISK